MKTKTFAVISDIVLVALILIGAVWLFVSGLVVTSWTTDRPLLPLVVDWSRIVLIVAALGVVAGLAIAALARAGRDRIVGNDAIRYGGYERLVHWALAIGFILDFATAAWLLRWFGLQSTPDIRPTLYLVHFIGAALIVFAAAAYVTSARVRGQDALFPRWRDVGPAIARLFGYLGVYGQPGVLGVRWPTTWLKGPLAAIGIKPAKREGKFLAVEKVLSFTPLAILALIVVGTGLVKSAHYFFLVPGDVLYWSTWLHDLAVWLTLIVVGLHLAAIFLVPRNWPGIRAMITGRMRLHTVEEEFPEWADELKHGEVAPKPKRVGVPSSAGGD